VKLGRGLRFVFRCRLDEFQILRNEGGHNIDPSVIERRFIGGIKNLFKMYLPIIENVLIFDNSEGNYHLIAEKNLEKEMTILDNSLFNLLQSYLK
jgi:predicted ABC-type ATPase